MPADDHAQNSRTRLALLRRKLVEPFDIFIRQIGEDTSHAILISYHDIMSNALEKYVVPKLLIDFRWNAKGLTLIGEISKYLETNI